MTMMTSTTLRVGMSFIVIIIIIIILFFSAQDISDTEGEEKIC